MSFWTQEDGSSGSDEDNNNNNGGRTLVCSNCGSTNFYKMNGLSYCNDCFTQSQMTQCNEELEYDDLKDLGYGNYINNKARKSYRVNVRSNQLNSMVDKYGTSESLPTCDTCCELLQTVLIEACQCISNTIATDIPLQHLHQRCKELWFSYLHSWQDAALSLQPLYPELRLSFRDFFLPTKVQLMLRRFISYEKATQTNNNKSTNNIFDDDDDVSKKSTWNKNTNSNAGDSSSSTSRKTTNTKEEEKKKKTRTVLRKRNLHTYLHTFLGKEGLYLSRQNPKKWKSKMAILAISPSISFVCGTIIGLAIRTYGYDFIHLLAWAKRGIYPYLLNPLWNKQKKKNNDDDNDDDDDEKEEEEDFCPKVLVDFFQPSYLPTPRYLAHQSHQLCKALGWNYNDKFELNVPLFLGHIVNDLQMPQSTYDIALSLLNITPCTTTTKDEDKKWLPAPIIDCFTTTIKNDEQQKLQYYLSPTHIIAYLVVAIRMTPGWQNWKLHLKQDIVHGNETNQQERWIPWSDDQLNIVGNGPMFYDYVDFFHTIIPSNSFFKDKRNHHESFLCNFKQYDTEFQTTNTSISDITVRPNLILACATNPNVPDQYYRKKKGKDDHSTLCYIRANGIGDCYIFYKDSASRVEKNVGPKTKESKLKRDSDKYNKNAGKEPYHPHYGFLIEFFSILIDIEPHELQIHVRTIDRHLYESYRSQKKKRKHS